MNREIDLAVVGLGGIGSAAAYWGAREGLTVAGFEQFELGHDRGASHDHSRIIRLSYHTPGYVELAKAAYDAWAALEADAGEQLIVRTGGLDLFPANAAIAPADYCDSLAAAGVAYEWLGAAEIRARWPQFQIADDVHALFQDAGGIAPAALATATHQGLATEHGARLHASTPITRIEPRHGEVVIDASGETWRAHHVVVAADAWTADLLEPLGVTVPLTVMREQVTYFDADDARFAVGRLPVWIWMDDPSFYGFPVYGEAGAVKAAQDCGGHVTTARDRTFAVDDDELARVDTCMHDLFGAAVGAPRRSKTCLYTLTPDRDFVLDAVPGAPEVLVALGAAHGFKFASWFGRTLVELARKGTTQHDLTPFRFDRPALTDGAYAPNWMV
ncbi:MAG TPA: N-methyl-L-tryptophan oxidase [Acidimicrobiia bacterium]|nr:N-methyl-L-tryptophan oxidase [Acidimicrobiia bacterium]